MRTRALRGPTVPARGVVELTEDDLLALDEASPGGATAGDRSPDVSAVHR